MKYILLIFISLSFLACGGPDKKEVKPPEEKPFGHVEQKAAAEKKKHQALWSYAGITGPEFWWRLDEKFIGCKEGKSQSPVALKWVKPSGPPNMTFNYQEVPVRVIDNGHTIQFNILPGNKLKLAGGEYELQQIHFHSTSEHTIAGKSYPLEIHFVHKNSAGQLAVLGVMGTVGAKNATLGKLWAGLPLEKGREFMYKDVMFNPKSLIPEKIHHYSYNGSLNTPPCTQGVSWSVFNTPIEMSLEQIEFFQKMYVGNNRPVQPMNKRTLKIY